MRMVESDMEAAGKGRFGVGWVFEDEKSDWDTRILVERRMKVCIDDSELA